MCPPGYHHNGFMATPELGHRMYGYMYIYIPSAYMHVSAFTPHQCSFVRA